MMITDEMVDAVASKLGDFRHPTGKRAVRVALDVAFMDVPEPLSAWERAALGQHGKDKDRIEALHQRIAELEEEREHAGIRIGVRERCISELAAKLEKVRATVAEMAACEVEGHRAAGRYLLTLLDAKGSV